MSAALGLRTGQPGKAVEVCDRARGRRHAHCPISSLGSLASKRRESSLFIERAAGLSPSTASKYRLPRLFGDAKPVGMVPSGQRTRTAWCGETFADVLPPVSSPTGDRTMKHVRCRCAFRPQRGRSAPRSAPFSRRDAHRGRPVSLIATQRRPGARRIDDMSSNETTGRTIALERGQRATAVLDHGGVHVTLNGHGSVAHVVATAAEARELAQLLLALADSLDAPKGAA